jgi:hypothetical protein
MTVMVPVALQAVTLKAMAAYHTRAAELLLQQETPTDFHDRPYRLHTLRSTPAGEFVKYGTVQFHIRLRSIL